MRGGGGFLLKSLEIEAPVSSSSSSRSRAGHNLSSQLISTGISSPSQG